MKQEEKQQEEMYNETEKLKRRLGRIKEGVRCKMVKGTPLYAKVKKLTEYNIEQIEEFSKYRVGIQRAIHRIETLEELGYKIDKDFNDLTPEEVLNYQKGLEQGKLAFNTVEVKKAIIKSFFSWLKLPNLAECITFRTRPKKDKEEWSEELLTAEDVRKVIQNCRNNRDKCFVSLLYESGCRISEIRGIKVKHIEIDKSGIAKVFLKGKTGSRRVMIRDSVPYLKVWLNEHPQAEDKGAYLFLTYQERRISYSAIRTSLQVIFKRAGIKKKCNPHIFRHSRATYLANYLTEQQLKSYLGWVQGSQMASVYVHLSGENINNALLSKVYNVKEVKQEAENNKLQPRECPKCKELNPSTHKFCGICSTPLDYESQEAVDKIKELIGGVISELMSKQQAINETNTKAIAREKLVEITPLIEYITKLQNK